MSPHLDYVDVIFDKAYNNSFQLRLESLQYKASLAVTGAIKVSPTEKLYQELWLKSFQNRQLFRKLCVFYKIVKEQSPKDLFNLIPSNSISYQDTKRFWYWNTESLFFHCPRFTNERQNFLCKIQKIIHGIFRETASSVTLILLYGDPSFLAELNTNTLNSSIDSIYIDKIGSTLFLPAIKYFIMPGYWQLYAFFFFFLYIKKQNINTWCMLTL